MQVNTVEYQYQPTPFNGTTEKQESYKHWDLPERPACPPVPMRATLPFTGPPHILKYTPGMCASACCSHLRHFTSLLLHSQEDKALLQVG